MKTTLWIMALAVVLVSDARRVEAQAYYESYYAPYADGRAYQVPAQEPYPYYQLEAVHYQLYVPYHQAYPVYPFYQPCCITGPVIVTTAPIIIRSRPLAVVNPPRMRRR